MNLSTLFARRYLVSEKSHSVINIVSRVSSLAVGIPVAAMVILLSVFNGFESLVKGMYGEFDPDILITVARDRVFDASQGVISAAISTPGVEAVSEVLEENALLEYRGRQDIATVRGVDSVFTQVIPLEGLLVEGNAQMRFGHIMQAVVGQGLAYNLGVRPAMLEPLRILVPRRGVSFSSILPIDGYRSERIFPTGIFMLDAETDGRYVLVPIEFMRALANRDRMSSALFVKLDGSASPESVAARLSETLGEQYLIRTRFEQKASFYRVMRYEKWGIFFIVLMVMVIASFSIVGTLVMLVIEKNADIRTLYNIGADTSFVRSVFMKEGMLIASLGALGGMALGLLVCWLQSAFGLVPIPARTFLVDSYPVKVEVADVFAVLFSYLAVSYIITKFTVVRMVPRSELTI